MREFRWVVIVLLVGVLPGIGLGLYVAGWAELNSHQTVEINVSETQPTGYPARNPAGDRRPIMQNPNCWNGIPGDTCGT